MKKELLLFFVICISQWGFGQNKGQNVEIVNHEVQANESVRTLSKKYLVDPADIYKLNRFAVNGISEGMMLQIPIQKNDISTKQEVKTNDSSQEVVAVVNNAEDEKEIAIELAINEELEANGVENMSNVKHIVEAKETVFGLSKKYNVTVEDIQLANPEVLKNGLQKGQVLVIPSKNRTYKKEASVVKASFKKHSEPIESTEEYIKHQVEPKETLYGLSKKYNITVDEIKQKNEKLLQSGLQSGQILLIKRIN